MVLGGNLIEPQWPTEAIWTCKSCGVNKAKYQMAHARKNTAMSNEKAWEVHLSGCTPSFTASGPSLASPRSSSPSFALSSPLPVGESNGKEKKQPPSPNVVASSPLVTPEPAPSAVPISVPSVRVSIPMPDANPVLVDAHPAAGVGDKRKSPESVAAAGNEPKKLRFATEDDQKRLDLAEQTYRELLTKAESEEKEWIQKREKITAELETKSRAVARLKVIIKSIDDP